MSRTPDDERQRLLAGIERRAAAGQIDRRSFLRLVAALGVGSTVAAAMADRALAAPSAQGLAGRNIESSYDYIIVGAGSAGCVIAA
jgi:choline dehydrogenase